MSQQQQRKRHKVIPRCYKRTLSRTLSNSSISQLVQIGSYKKKINVLARNNRQLAVTLQEIRLEAALQQNILKDCAKDYNKILFARLKLNEMAKNLAKFVTDLEEVRGYLNVKLPTENPFTQKKGSPDKLCKEPEVDCIEEVTEESSVINDVLTSENVTIPAKVPPNKSDNNKSPDHQNSEKTNHAPENVEMPPILFAEDSEGKKKSLNKGKSSSNSYGPDKGSLSPESNTDLSSVKLKRKSSRRLTQVFRFSGTRSTSRGRPTSVGKENSPKESQTPEKPKTPIFTLQKQIQEEICENPVSNDTKEKGSENPNNFVENKLQSAFDANQCEPCDVSTMNPEKIIKIVTTAGIQPAEANHTVILCEDMELTEVIRPPIIVSANSDYTTRGCDIAKETQQFNAADVCVAAHENHNMEITSESNPHEMLTAHPNTLKLLKDDVQLLKINEHDEVQNVGLLTFCEQNEKDENIESRAATSTRMTRRKTKPIKYHDFFLSDESDLSFEFHEVQPANNHKKRGFTEPNKTTEKTEGCIKKVSSTKIDSSSEKNESSIKTVSCAKIKSSERSEDHIKTVDCTKTVEIPQKTQDHIKTVSSTKTVEIPQKTQDHIKTVSSTKTVEIPEKTRDCAKTVSSTKTVEIPEKTQAHIKTVSSTKTVEIPQKTQAHIKTVNSTKTVEIPQKTQAHIKTVSSTKTVEIPEKTDDHIKTVNSTTSKSEKVKDHMKTGSSTETNKSEAPDDPIKTINTTKISKTKKTAELLKIVSSTEVNESDKNENATKTQGSITVSTLKNTKDVMKTACYNTNNLKKIENPIKKKGSTKIKKSEKNENTIKTSSSTKTSKFQSTKDLKKIQSSSKDGESSEKTDDTVKTASSEVCKAYEDAESPWKYCIDDLHSRKAEKKSSKKSKDVNHHLRIKQKKSSQKHIATSKEDNFETNKDKKAKKLVSHPEHVENPVHENFKKIACSPDFSPGGILKKTPPNFHTAKKMGNEAPLKNIIFDDSDDTFTRVTETPKSESKRVSFAATDVVCNFRRMSVSKKIAENKKVRRTSKSVTVDGDKTRTKTDADNSSETTNPQKAHKIVFNFSNDDDTEVYPFQMIPSSSDLSPVPTHDDLMPKFSASVNSHEKNLSKTDKHPRKTIPASESGKLSLKRSKDLKNTEPVNDQRMLDELSKRSNALLYESPISVPKSTKRKSLFKEDFDGASKENVNLDYQIPDVHKDLPQQKETKRQSKVQRKASAKKLPEKPKLPEQPEIKKIRQSCAVRGLANSPVLKDTINLPEDARDGLPLKRRSSKAVSYKEPLLNKKMRRD